MPSKRSPSSRGTEAAPSGAETKRVRLIFVDEGSYHRETLTLPLAGVQRYDRLIDYLREDPAVLGRMYVDVDRLCAAYIIENGDDD